MRRSVRLSVNVEETGLISREMNVTFYFADKESYSLRSQQTSGCSKLLRYDTPPPDRREKAKCSSAGVIHGNKASFIM